MVADSVRGGLSNICYCPSAARTFHGVSCPRRLVTYTVHLLIRCVYFTGTVGLDDYWPNTYFVFDRSSLTPTYYSPFVSGSWAGLYVTQALVPGQSESFSYMTLVSNTVGLGLYYSILLRCVR